MMDRLTFTASDRRCLESTLGAADLVLARMEAIELEQLALDVADERPFVELGIIDLGGEA